MSDAEKKTQPILLRLPASLEGRLNTQAERKHIGRQDIIRLGLDEILTKFEQEQPPSDITPAEAAALSQARSLGINPLACLTAAVEAHLAANSVSPIGTSTVA